MKPSGVVLPARVRPCSFVSFFFLPRPIDWDSSRRLVLPSHSLLLDWVAPRLAPLVRLQGVLGGGGASAVVDLDALHPFQAVVGAAPRLAVGVLPAEARVAVAAPLYHFFFCVRLFFGDEGEAGGRGGVELSVSLEIVFSSLSVFYRPASRCQWDGRWFIQR